MANKTYTYPIVNFPNGTVDTALLTTEIQASSISTSLVNIIIGGDDCLITFNDTLATDEYGVFYSILQNHQGTQTTYTYSISEDFPTGAVNPDQLWEEILASYISSNVVRVITDGDDDGNNCNCIFETVLSIPDKTTLDGLVANHVPIKLVYVYSISEDFPDQKVDAAALDTQIVAASSISTVLEGVNTREDVCNIVFASQLAVPEITALGLLVANHDGEPVVYTTDAYAENLRSVDTSKTTWTQALRLSLPNCPAGTYRVEWSFEWATSNSSASINVQVQLDDTITLATYIMNNTPSLTTTTLSKMGEVEVATSYPNLNDGKGFARVTLSEGSHFIDFDYKASNASYAVKIGSVKIEAVKVKLTEVI